MGGRGLGYMEVEEMWRSLSKQVGRGTQIPIKEREKSKAISLVTPCWTCGALGKIDRSLEIGQFMPTMIL